MFANSSSSSSHPWCFRNLFYRIHLGKFKFSMIRRQIPLHVCRQADSAHKMVGLIFCGHECSHRNYTIRSPFISLAIVVQSTRYGKWVKKTCIEKIHTKYIQYNLLSLLRLSLCTEEDGLEATRTTLDLLTVEEDEA